MKKKTLLSFPFTGDFKVTSPFGDRIHPVTGVKTFHNGIDVATPLGTNLYAVSSGVVADVYENPTGGKQMIIDYDNGFRFGFAHLDKQLISKGTRVEKGDLLAQTGNTGKTTGAHLHWTVRKNGKLVNPLDYV